MKRRFRGTIAAVTVLGLLTGHAYARPASTLQDLVGVRGSSGESELSARGFVYVDGHDAASGSVHTYWWHGRDRNCINVKTYDGRYQSIRDASPADCNQRTGGGGNAGTAVAAIAGIALIAALASHKSSHHGDGKHYGEARDEEQYERGYRDGLYNMAYHNYDRVDAYARGYESGVEQRRYETSYHKGHGGYHQH